MKAGFDRPQPINIGKVAIATQKEGWKKWHKCVVEFLCWNLVQVGN